MNARDGSVTHPTPGLTRLAFTRRYDHPVDEVWGMLTDPALTQLWWARADRFDLVDRGEVDLQWLNSDEQGLAPRARGSVCALEPGRVLALDTDVFGILRFELAADAGGTALAFSATLPVDPAWEAKVMAGWHWRFDALAQALAGHPVDWVEEGRPAWLAHWRRYTEKLGWGG